MPSPQNEQTLTADPNTSTACCRLASRRLCEQSQPAEVSSVPRHQCSTCRREPQATPPRNWRATVSSSETRKASASSIHCWPTGYAAAFHFERNRSPNHTAEATDRRHRRSLITSR